MRYNCSTSTNWGSFNFPGQITNTIIRSRIYNTYIENNFTFLAQTFISSKKDTNITVTQIGEARIKISRTVTQLFTIDSNLFLTT